MSNRKKRTAGTAAAKSGVAILLIAMSACSTGALAQNGAQTWRCGNTYSDRPCAGGKTVKVDDPRSEQDRRAADAGARGLQAQADHLERTRLSQEKAAHDRDHRAAREARSDALAERRLAMSEQKERERARKAASDPRKSSMSFSAGPSAKAAGDAPERKKKKRKPAAD